MIGFPDLPSTAMTRLSVFADLEKGGTAWQNELRIPAGQPGGGQWTTGGASDATAAGGGNAAHTTPPIEGGERNPLLDNGIYRPLSIDWSLAPKTVADAQVRGFSRPTLSQMR